MRHVTRIGSPRATLAIAAGGFAGRLSRRLGLGDGSVIGGRVALAVDPCALSRLAANRLVVLVCGTNGKTTTAHLLAAALRTRGPVAHNATGANMADGAVAALMARPAARWAVLEVDELHLERVFDAVRPDVLLLLNFTRDQLDRVAEVAAVAARATAALARHPGTVVVANADDPVVVRAVRATDVPAVWVAAGAHWQADTGPWQPDGHPAPLWTLRGDDVVGPCGQTPLKLRLPGPFNRGNAALALAAADVLGVPMDEAAAAVSAVDSVAGRYAVARHHHHVLHLLLAKNPAGWAEVVPLLEEARSLLLVVNAREADGRDTSWLWDVPFEELPVRPTVVSGERASDLGLRLSYADRAHRTEPDPLRGLRHLPPGAVHVVANYTAFRRLIRRLGVGAVP